jgi:hypothetical protein
MAKGILIAAMDFSACREDEFHDWYDLEHVPERLRIPGFLNAERWIDVKNPKIAVATYDLETVGVLQSAPYVAVFRRGITLERDPVGAVGHVFQPP